MENTENQIIQENEKQITFLKYLFSWKIYIIPVLLLIGFFISSGDIADFIKPNGNKEITNYIHLLIIIYAFYITVKYKATKLKQILMYFSFNIINFFLMLMIGFIFIITDNSPETEKNALAKNVVKKMSTIIDKPIAEGIIISGVFYNKEEHTINQTMKYTNMTKQEALEEENNSEQELYNDMKTFLKSIVCYNPGYTQTLEKDIKTNLILIDKNEEVIVKILYKKEDCENLKSDKK